MICEKCGYTLSSDWNVCPICSKVVNDNSDNTQNELFPINTEIMQKPTNELETKLDIPEKPRSSDTERKFIIVFVVSYSLAILIAMISSSIAGSGRHSTTNLSALMMLCHLVALVTIVTAYIKFPKNRTIRILFWIYIGLIILQVIAAIILLITCIHACRTCPWRA